MYVAHVAPVPGPARVLELSEYLTMPLFALLVGVSAQLGARSATGVRWWRSTAVRAAVLIGLGVALERAGAQVVIVLVHLGVLVLVAGVLTRLSTVAVAAVATAATVAGPVLLGRAAPGAVDEGGWATAAQDVVWGGGPYRLLTMVVYAALGIVVSRWWLRGAPARSVLLPGAVGVVLLMAAAVMLAAEQLGRIDLVPYSGTLQETVLDVLLTVGVLGVGLASARGVARVRAGRRAVSVLAAAGAMTLTLYAIQVLWLAYDVRVLHPGQADDSWANLAVLVGGSLVLAATWVALVRREPWRKGPVEGLVGALVRGRGPTSPSRTEELLT
jgi:hypothetical protein